MKYILEGGQAEVIEKKSRFIGTVYSISSEEEALERIAALKKQYWNASHNCFAYVLGDRHEIQRCSDDREPSGTAGKPILDVLLGEGIHNAVIVVTRYFGGTLLGTGGLVRAYSKSAQEGLRESVVIDRQSGCLLTIGTDYNGVGKIQYLLGVRGIRIIDSQYTDAVRVKALVPEEEIKGVKAEITEGTHGKAEFLEEKMVSFAFYEGEPLLFE